MLLLAGFRGGPLDILGGGCQIQKKFMQEIELEKFLHALKKEKKFVQLHAIVRIYVEHMYTLINK